MRVASELARRALRSQKHGEQARRLNEEAVIDLHDTTLAILAGGEGSRMGKPKGELLVGGKPILHYLLERLSWPGPTMLVTAPGREHPPAWQRFSSEVVDPTAGAGPLRGILTALENAKSELVIVTPVDMPLVERSQLEWLAGQIGDSLGVMTSRGETIEPFPSALKTIARDVIRQQLESGRGGIGRLTKLPQFRAVAAPSIWNESVWTNLNTVDDLDRLSS